MPEHYRRDPEPIKVIIQWLLNYPEGNILKYLARYREKGGSEDLKKLFHYAAFLLASEYQIGTEVTFSDGTTISTSAESFPPAF